MKITYCPNALCKLELGKKPYTYCRKLVGECKYMVLDNCETRTESLRHQKLKGLAKLLEVLLK